MIKNIINYLFISDPGKTTLVRNCKLLKVKIRKLALVQSNHRNFGCLGIFRIFITCIQWWCEGGTR